jgi:hypothetical protein
VEFREPAAGWSAPADARRPEVMAIGDSLYNGMRSLTLDAGLARQASPALVAAALGVPFAAPDYPRPLLVRLDEATRTTARLRPAAAGGAADDGMEAVAAELLGGLGRVLADVRGNARFWVRRALAGDGAPRLFDNLAIAGAEVGHLLDVSAADWRARLRIWRPVVGRGADPLAWPGQEPAMGRGWGLADLHMAINGAFLLDPAGDPRLADLRPIDHVALRRPRRLLISLGASHGLARITAHGDLRGGREGLRAFRTLELPRLLAHLAALPGEVETIVLNTLPLPSQIPNLMPVGMRDGAAPERPAGGRYFARYETRLPLSGQVVTVSGSDVAALDREVLGLNAALAAMARGADPRIKVCPLHEALARCDGKHAATCAERGEAGRDNSAPDLAPGPRGCAAVGRLVSLDGHHPSALGQRLVAAEVLAVLGGPALPPAAVAEDKEEPPHGAVALARAAYRHLGGTGGGAGGGPPAERELARVWLGLAGALSGPTPAAPPR